MSRLLYSTDASSYEILPVGVVLPRDADDVAAAVAVAAAYEVPVLPRGSGTSLSGQTVGAALVLDLSRHLNRILAISPDERWVRVEAGAVLDQVNGALASHGLMIGPDPASSPVATLGGMTGNNSTGAHSIVYGMMVDHTLEVGVVLSDGSHARFTPCPVDTLVARAAATSLEGRLYREVPALLDRFRHAIATGYPEVWRNVAGYNLNRMVNDLDAGLPFNLTPLIVGSEGTLATVTDVTVRLVDRPSVSRLVIAHFGSLRESLEAVPAILECQPDSVELMDRFPTQLTRRSPEHGPRLHFIEGDPQAILIVEFAGAHSGELAERAGRLESALRRQGHRGALVHQTRPSDVKNVWIARKAGFGLLMSRRGDAKPLAFSDDAVVPIHRLAEYAREAEKLCREAGTEPSFSAHVSAGCLHIMPLVNLKTPKGLKQMRDISEGIAHLAIRLGGTTTGEHGEGLARSHYNERLYGPELHQAFREIKRIFDPLALMNPGKIVDAPLPWEPDLLRIHPGYRTPLAPSMTYFDFSQDGGFAGAVEQCNGQGLCRKRGSGIMCPSYMVTGEEAHSTRGRANALRAAMTGKLGTEGMANAELHEVLDLCVQCKACRRECPSGVDLARLKSEVLAQRHKTCGVPARDWLFGHAARLSTLGSLFPGLSNWMLSHRRVRRVMDTRLGIDARRPFPPFAAQSFRKWFHGRNRNGVKPAAGRRLVVLWDDFALSYHEPEVGRAAVQVLEAAGFDVSLVAGRRCDARPQISKGLLDEARRNARHNIALLDPLAAGSIPIIGLEPSSMGVFRDEYPLLVPTEAARRVARHTFLLEEWLCNLAEAGQLNLPFKRGRSPVHILVHGHCHQKADTGIGPLLRMLRLIPNATVEEIPSSCCGMAGSFGFEREHYEISMAIGEDRLFPAVRRASPETLIAAPGFSCRQHIAHGTGRKAVHPVVLLAEALEGEGP